MSLIYAKYKKYYSYIFIFSFFISMVFVCISCFAIQGEDNYCSELCRECNFKDIATAGKDNQFSTFNTDVDLPVTHGIILSNGDATKCFSQGSNELNTNNRGDGDTRLDTIYQQSCLRFGSKMYTGKTYDAAELKFSVTPKQSSIKFNYFIASEEFFSSSQQNDVVAILVNGENIAKINDNPTTIKDIAKCGSITKNENKKFGFSGYSGLLTAEATVTPGSPVDISIIIADSENHKNDTAVFIESNIFPNQKVPPAAPLISNYIENESVTVTSETDSDAYLVLKDNYASYTDVISKSILHEYLSKSTPKQFHLCDLDSGTYQIYLIDGDNTLSPPSIDIVVSKPILCKVRFLDGVSVIHNVNVSYGYTLSNIPTPPSKTGFTSSWNFDTSTPITTDTDISVIYTPILCKVRFMDGTSVIHTVNVSYGETLSQIPTPPSKAGFTSSWNFDTSAPITSDTDINVIYAPILCNVRFLDGVSVIHTVNVSYGETLSNIPTPPSKAGFTSSWNFDTSAPITSDTDINVIYAPILCNVRFLDGASVIHTVNVSYGEKLSQIPTPPSKAGFTSSWNFDTSTPITTDTDINVIYAPILCKVRFLDGASVIHTVNVSYGETLSNIPTPPSKTGFTSSWNFDTSTPITTDTDISVIYTPILCKVRFLDGSSVIHTVNVSYGETLSNVPVPPSKTGFTSSWNFDSSTPITTDTDISVIYTPILCKVRFLDGSSVIHTVNVSYGETLSNVPTPPSKIGFTSSWESSLSQIITNHTDIHVIYSPNIYKITFFDGEKAICYQTYKYGEAIQNLPPVPLRDGYLVSWNISKDYVVTGDVEVHTTYSKKDINVTFIADNQIISTVMVGYGEKLDSLPSIPYKSGYTAKWSIDKDTPITCDTIVTVAYSKKEYTVTFMDGNDIIGEKQALYGDKLSNLTPLPPLPQKEGYVAKWNISADKIVTSNTTVNVSYTKKPCKVTFMDGDNIVTTKSILYGNTLTSLPYPPSKDGYSYKWSIDKDAPITCDTIVTVAYAKKEYTVTFMDGDDIIGEKQALYGDKLSNLTPLPPLPQKEGYIAKWNISADKIVTSNTTVNVSYTKKPCKVTFMDGDNIVTTKYILYGNTLTSLPYPPSKDGYSYKWSIDKDTPITSDTIVTVVYSKKVYNVTFMDGDDIIDEKQALYGDKLSNLTPLPPLPQKDGYDAKWNISADKIVTSNTTVNVSYTKKPGEISVSLPDSTVHTDSSNLKIAVTNKTDQTSVAKGDNIQISLCVTPKKGLSEDEQNSLNSMRKIPKDYKCASVTDISITKNGKRLSTIKSPIEMSIDIPFDILNENRVFYVVNFHNGKPYLLPCEIVDGKAIFTTKQFSTFALIYSDNPQSEKSVTATSANKTLTNVATASLSEKTNSSNTGSTNNPDTDDKNLVVFVLILMLTSVGTIKRYYK